MRKPRESAVNVTELRQNLPTYLAKVRKGGEIEVTSHGKIIARITPGSDTAADARARLIAARKQCKVGDVVAPLEVRWDAER